MTAIAKLLEIRKELKLWETIQSISFWDQLTVMPKESSQYRGEQNALLAKTRHERLTSQEYQDRLCSAAEEVEPYDSNHPLKIQVKRLKESFDRNIKLPTELVADLAKASVEGSRVWELSKSEGNAAPFLKELDNLVDLAKQKAEAYGYQDNSYDALIEDFEPEMTVNDFDKLYDPMKDELANLVQEAAKLDGALPIEGSFPKEQQEKLSQDLAKELGFQFSNGAINESSHPFSVTMGANDFRITTRYLPEDPFSSFYSTAHEVGHSLYERGLSKEHFGTPLGEAATAGVHESQSLFWENRVCRSPEFLANWHKEITSSYSQFKDWNANDLIKTVNQVTPSYIRVEADETTYSLHIIIRYEIEKMLFNDQIKPSEVEQVWNDLYKKYLGLEVKDPVKGCLQDVHWSEGLFGYFPSYALGHILSAQFSATMNKDLGGLDSHIKQKKYGEIVHWLGAKVHSQGQKYYGKELIKSISGQEISSQPFLEYLKAKRERG